MIGGDAVCGGSPVTRRAHDTVAAMAISQAGPFLFAAIVLGSACRVERPSGYDALVARAPTVTLSPTPGRLTGVMPTSWVLSDGRRAAVDIQRSSATWGVRPRDLAFEVWIDGAAPSARLSCTTDALGKAGAEARFSCRATQTPTEVVLTVAPGAPACVTQPPLSTWRDSSCWEGVLNTPTDRYTVSYAQLERSKLVINQLVWTGADGRPVQAVDSVGEWRLALHRDDAPPEDRDILLLHALALHLWSHALYGD